MKTVGFIEYFLDEFHANHYPKWIEEASGGEMKVAYAWAKLAVPPQKRSTKDWCAAHGVRECARIEDVIEKSDYLVVLSPDNPEMHEELCELPLRSGKRVYVDKTFAPDAAAARRIFANANAHHTPVYSSSALRFADGLTEFRKTPHPAVDWVASIGPGRPDNYLIHQIEPVVSLLGAGPRRVMCIGTEKAPSWVVDYGGGRAAFMSLFGGDVPFALRIRTVDGSLTDLPDAGDYFTRFIEQMVDFFRTGEIKVSQPETVAVMEIREKALRALEAPGSWVSCS